MSTTLAAAQQEALLKLATDFTAGVISLKEMLAGREALTGQVETIEEKAITAGNNWNAYREGDFLVIKVI